LLKERFLRDWRFWLAEAWFKVPCVFLLPGFEARATFSAVFDAGASLERCR